MKKELLYVFQVFTTNLYQVQIQYLQLIRVADSKFQI